jgi:hypothetical protein
MNRTARQPIVVALVALVPALMLVVRSAGQDAKRAEFMRKKLELSKNLLEGLTTEDFSLIAKNAKALRVMSQAAEWEAPTIPDVDNYLSHTAEFQRITGDMIKKADAKNLDGATLDFVRMTTSCVNCHKYVRSSRK